MSDPVGPNAAGCLTHVEEAQVFEYRNAVGAALDESSTPNQHVILRPPKPARSQS